MTIGSCFNSHSLVFPRWDAISILFSVFLLSYIYIESVSVCKACYSDRDDADQGGLALTQRSNYQRGSLLILSYLVLLGGFVFAPNVSPPNSTVGERLLC